MSAQKDLHLGNNPLKIVIVTINVAGGKVVPETTVATNLALSIESDVLLHDCTDKASTETDREQKNIQQGWLMRKILD